MKDRTKRRLGRKAKPLVLVEMGAFHHLEKQELFQQAEEHGWQLYDLTISKGYLPTNLSPSGAIISSRYGSKSAAHEGRVFDMPTVRLGGTAREISDRYPLVLYDRRAAGWMAADYFAEGGFGNIVILTEHDWNMIHESYKGLVERANELGMDLHHQVLKTKRGEGSKAKRERWKDEIGQIVSALHKPLAFFGCNDSVAARFCHDCHSYGLSVPEDVAVLGVGNKPFICDAAPVPLSSIDTNRSLMIGKTVGLLKRLLAGEAPPAEPTIIPPKGVVVRRSTDMLAVSDPRIARALRYMWDHLEWPLTVDDVSRETGVSKRTLARLFKKELGRGINEELRRKRLEKCCELLKHSSMAVKDISRLIGFQSQSHLHMTFLKAFGTTPVKFRKKSSESA